MKIMQRVEADIEAEEKALEEIMESLNENTRSLEQSRKDIEEIRLTIEASSDVQTDATKELEAKKEEKEKFTAAQKEFFGKTEELSKQISDLENQTFR